MKLAVRVLKAWPWLLRKAPVTAFEIAAVHEGTHTPSSPQLRGTPAHPEGVQLLPTPTRVLSAAPVILKTPSTLPSLSTTAIVAFSPLASACATACAITVLTSSSLRLRSSDGFKVR